MNTEVKGGEMKMRMFDTELFHQDWFINLSSRHQLVYIYILMNCDLAGVFEISPRRMTCDMHMDEKPITHKDVFGPFGDRVLPIEGSDSKALVPDFIGFHYGKHLVNDGKHHLHKTVAKAVAAANLTLEYINERASEKYRFEFDDFSDVLAESRPKQACLLDVPKDKEAKKRKGAFEKPTLEEVKDYFTSNGTVIDPEEFWAYYEQKGWKDKNGNRIKNWKACLVTWEKYRKKGGVESSAPSWSVGGRRTALHITASSEQAKEAKRVLG